MSSHAHSWVEVRLQNGDWAIIDPTPPLRANTQSNESFFSEIKNFLESILPAAGYKGVRQLLMSIFCLALSPFVQSIN